MSKFAGLLIAGLLLAFAWLTPAFSDQRIPILMYHSINNGGRDLQLAPEAFQKHLDYIRDVGYTTVTFKEIAWGFVVQKPIILSFDDGVISHWYAYEELKKRNMVGVFFPVYNIIGDKWRNKNYLNSDQAKIMAQNGMEIGSHGMSHPDLRKASTQKIGYELNESKDRLEKLLNTEVITFCIPYGWYDKRTLQILEQSNYHYARTTNEGISTFGQTRNFGLKIIYIHRKTLDLGREIERVSSFK